MNEKYKDIYRKVGGNIKRERISRGWTQEYLANSCDKIDRSKISDLENAKEDFMFSTLLEIAAAFNIDVNNLIK